MYFFFFKQKTAYEMRISDWSSDVCSSDLSETSAALVVIEHDMPLLRAVSDRLIAMDQGGVIATGEPEAVLADPIVVESYLGSDQIGRASCRERVCPYV